MAVLKVGDYLLDFSACGSGKWDSYLYITKRCLYSSRSVNDFVVGVNLLSLDHARPQKFD